MNTKPQNEIGNVIRAVAGSGDTGARLDRFLAERIDELSRSRLKQLLLEGHVRVGGRTIGDPSYRVKSGDAVDVELPPPRDAKPRGEAIPLQIVHEDDQLIVIDKPAGLVVHPAAGNEAGTLVNALIAHCSDSLSGIGGEKRPGIVHRLDKDTSGLLVVAKSDLAHRALARQFADHGKSGDLVRGYLALVWGVPKPPRGEIDAPIGRDPKSRLRMAVRPSGRRAVTRYQLRETFADSSGKPLASLLECRLETGRTHQIRVHLARAGHPLLGDALYGAGYRTKASQLPEQAQQILAGLQRQALHAYLLGFRHPLSKKQLVFESPLPPDLASLVSALKSP